MEKKIPTLNKFYVFSFTLLVILAFAILSSCKKENKIDKNSPAFFISESEKLVIPNSIALPSNLPNGNSKVATFYAQGVQKYKAQQKAGSTTEFEWVFVAPQANLYDATNKKVGDHSAGPTWELTGGTDSLFGQDFNPPRSEPGTDAFAIDWLLLMPKTGKTPTGIFANVSYIQRIATTGGKAPTDPPLTADETYDAPYTAIYRFTKVN